MLEEDSAKITVHLVQFEKYANFCMPGAAPEGWPDERGSALRIGGRRLRSSRAQLRAWSGFSEVFVRYLLTKKWLRLPSCVLQPGGWVGVSPDSFTK